MKNKHLKTNDKFFKVIVFILLFSILSVIAYYYLIYLPSYNEKIIDFERNNKEESFNKINATSVPTTNLKLTELEDERVKQIKNRINLIEIKIAELEQKIDLQNNVKKDIFEKMTNSNPPINPASVYPLIDKINTNITNLENQINTLNMEKSQLFVGI